MHEDVVYARRALQAGAKGYLTKGSAPDSLVEAVRSVARGETYLAAQVAAGEAGPDALSPREFEVLRWLAQGHPVRDIAERLGVTAKTVANQQTLIRQKLGAETPLQLLRAAVRLGLVDES
jgi:DNA-binding NarL/FixJ family response regulator